MSNNVTIGIDLGTSNSCVAAVVDGEPRVLPNILGERITASVVAFHEDGRIQVGNTAKAQILRDPRHTVSSAKRLIGRYFFSEEVRKARVVYRYEIISGENNSVRIRIRDEEFSLPEISAFVLEEMKQVAEQTRAAVPSWVPTRSEYSLYDVDEEGMYHRVDPAPVRKRCDWHYISAAINPDGAVAPCCALFRKKDDFGIVGQEEGPSYMEVFNNDAFTSVRDSIAGRREEATGLICEQCPSTDIMDYAKEVNKDILLTTFVGLAESVRLALPRLLRPLRRGRRAAARRLPGKTASSP